ncbi:MAG: efflux transporter outer membrane subunit [Synergistaceae bacterium]|jgi:NodT family efflux transporter outer membrane factor (OMF) lipoprotein|nr:efflux transporter outer membrane subunit [Synergistaceae bacterium]
MKTARITLLSFTLAAIFSLRCLAGEAVVSDDADVRGGAWETLVRRYGVPGAADAAENPGSLSPEALASWWKTLGDETLDTLILWSIENNRSLRAARAKTAEARAALGISRAATLPWLDNADSWTRGKTPVNSAGSGVSAGLHRLSIDANWEIDIFGSRSEMTNAAVAALEAEHASLHAAWVTLSSEVALNYLSLRTLQERLEIAERNLALQMETIEMLGSQYEAGLMDSLALNQAQYTAEGTRASIPPIRSSIESVMNTLAILVGRVPGSLEEMLSEPKSLPKPHAVNLLGIPADAIRQRPDIRAAERLLASQIARKRSAERDLLPKFFLFGSIGLESLSGGNLFSSGSFSYSFGPRITLPIFHGGAIRKNIKVQTAREEQYLAAYEEAVLSAVAEVRNALAASAQETRRNESLKSGIAAAKAALGIAEDKYKNGLTDFSNVIGAQSALLSLEDQFTVSEGQMTSNVVRIFKALGGGWAPMTEE